MMMPSAMPQGAPATGASDTEQKRMDACVEDLSRRVNDVRTAIATLATKLETEANLNWSSFLDSIAIVTAQLNSLLKFVKNERNPKLKSYICLPLALAPDRDEDLLRLTDGRVAAFSHDLVPDYLRTKPDPEVESKHAQFESKGSSYAHDKAQKELNALEKTTKKLEDQLKKLSHERDTLDGSRARDDMDKTSVIEDTFMLVAAITSGKNLRASHPMGMGQGAGPAGMMRPGANPMMPGMGPGGMTPQMAQSQVMNKAPSVVKTNIKAASSVNPYNR